jgi:hypothetical protein
MTVSSVFIIAAGIMFFAAFIVSIGEVSVPPPLSAAYFFLALANISFAFIK